MKLFSLSSFTLALFAMGASCFSAVVLQDDFSSYTAGDPLPWNSSSNATSGEAYTRTLVEADAANLFGKGVNNQYASFEVHSISQQTISYTATRIRTGTGFGRTGQIGFSFYQPSSADNSGYGFLLRIGGGTGYNSNGSTAFGLFFRDGNLYAATGNNLARGDLLGAYDQDQVNQLVIVYNQTTASHHYTGGGLQAQSMDLWLNGEKIASNLLHAGELAGDTDLTWLNFTNLGQVSSATLYLDDLVIDDVASIPEPKTVLMLLPALFAIRLLRRRSHR
ncbi:MAG TPA: hypothetical protein VNQ90_17515 [Chthoniobacteraceae bacterium]|nr:hypothetical protein [Chthoniobacteraceae bacterium]